MNAWDEFAEAFISFAVVVGVALLLAALAGIVVGLWRAAL